MFRMLLSFLLGKPRALTHLQVVMYTRQGCHLCEQAWKMLEAARQRHGFQLTALDVDHDPELLALHGDQVPVVAFNGKVRFRGHINPALLRRQLRAEAHGH